MSNSGDEEQALRGEHRAAIKAAVALANSIVKPAAAERRSPRTDARRSMTNAAVGNEAPRQLAKNAD